MNSYRAQQTASGGIDLPRGGGEVKSFHETREGYRAKEEEPLSKIVREMNGRFWNGENEYISII